MCVTMMTEIPSLPLAPGAYTGRSVESWKLADIKRDDYSPNPQVGAAACVLLSMYPRHASRERDREC